VAEEKIHECAEKCDLENLLLAHATTIASLGSVKDLKSLLQKLGVAEKKIQECVEKRDLETLLAQALDRYRDTTRREKGLKRALGTGAPATKKSRTGALVGDTSSNALVVDDDSEAEGAERSLDAAAPRHMQSESSVSSGGGRSAATAALSGARHETTASVEEMAYSMLTTLFDDNRLSYDVCEKVRLHFNVKCIEDLSYLEDRDIAKLGLLLVDCRKLEKLVQAVLSPSFKKPAKEALPHDEMPGNVDAEIPDSVRPKALLRARFGDGRRVALCIGIDDYPGNQRLQNCVADAEDMRDCCEHQLGFHVARVLTNPKRRDILQALRELREAMEDGSLVSFFFSGHGVEHEGVNYLLPLGMESTRVEDHEDQAVYLDLIINKFRKGTAVDCNIVNVMLLDCCRENADTKTFKSTNGGDNASGFGKSITKSLRSTSTNAEFLVGLACDPGTQALANDDARNSRYTEALLKHLPVTGRQLEESMKEVSKDVYNKTQKRQRPWTHNCLHQSVVLVPR
jgi:hypothetical protein